MEFDFDAAVTAPFRMQPGLRRLAAGAPVLTPLAPADPSLARHLREKLAVLSAFAGEALLARPGFDAAPALASLCEGAAREHPTAFNWNGRRAEAPLLGVAVEAEQVQSHSIHAFDLGAEVARCLNTLPGPWRLAGLLALAFAEDMALIDAADASIPWIAAALPSNWAPQDKVGRSFAEVHAPVAEAAQVVKAAPALVNLVCGSERWERFVWTLTPNPRLHAHPNRSDPRGWTLTPVERAWFRSEHQRFLPLPGLGLAAFTIRVALQPLADVAATPGRADRIHDALASMTPAVLAYRGLHPVRDDLLAWLAARR